MPRISNGCQISWLSRRIRRDRTLVCHIARQLLHSESQGFPATFLANGRLSRISPVFDWSTDNKTRQKWRLGGLKPTRFEIRMPISFFLTKGPPPRGFEPLTNGFLQWHLTL